MTRRHLVRVSQDSLVKTRHLEPGRALPLVVEPAISKVNLVTWVASNRDFIPTHLLNYGGILFRGFQVQSDAEFEQFIVAISGELLEYHDRATPRTQVSGKIYTSTDYPADQRIELHNESS